MPVEGFKVLEEGCIWHVIGNRATLLWGAEIGAEINKSSPKPEVDFEEVCGAITWRRASQHQTSVAPPSFLIGLFKRDRYIWYRLLMK